MTNYEKNKTQLDMYAVANVSWGVDADGKVFECDFCNHCIFCEDGHCTENRLKWLQQKYIYKEPEVDWTKVEVDTPIWVRDSEDVNWKKRYFAGYLLGKVHAFYDASSSESYACIYPWNYAKLAEGEESK